MGWPSVCADLVCPPVAVTSPSAANLHSALWRHPVIADLIKDLLVLGACVFDVLPRSRFGFWGHWTYVPVQSFFFGRACMLFLCKPRGAAGVCMLRSFSRYCPKSEPCTNNAAHVLAVVGTANESETNTAVYPPSSPNLPPSSSLPVMMLRPSPGSSDSSFSSIGGGGAV